MIELPVPQLEKILAYHNTAQGQSTLISAALVSKHWSIPSQSQLFKIAWIRSADGLHLFADIISKEQRLRSHVTEVRLTGGDERNNSIMIDSLKRSTKEQKEERRQAVDCSDLIKRIFTLCPGILFASFARILGVESSLSEKIESIDTDEYFGSASMAEDASSSRLRPAMKRITIRNGDLTQSSGLLQFNQTLSLFPNLSSLRLVNLITSPSTVFPAQYFTRLDHIVLHDGTLTDDFSSLLPLLDSLISLTLPIHHLTSPLTGLQQSPLLLIPSSSLITLRLLRSAHSTPPTPSSAHTQCQLLSQHIIEYSRSKTTTLKKMCVDWSYWGGRKVLQEMSERTGIRIIWGIFTTADEEWDRTAWGARLPEYDHDHDHHH
jgi:hypothetical protein